MTEPEVLPHHDRLGAKSIEQHPDGEILGRHSRHLRCKAQYQYRICSCRFQQLNAATQRRQRRRRDIWGYDDERMWIEGDHDEGDAAAVTGDDLCLLEQMLVPEVYPVVVSDRYDR